MITSGLSYLPHQGVIASTANAVRAMDSQIIAAIDLAREAGVPQGLIVGLLHGHAHQQTTVMAQDFRTP